MSSPTSLRTTAVRRCLIPRCAQEGARATGLARLHRENRRGVRALSAQPRRIAVSGRHPRLLAGNANALDPLLTDLYETLSAFTRLEGIQTEYGPGQIETNLVYTDALEAADDAVRLKYAAKEVARKHGKIASFMPKPFTEHSGSSQHLHISLWRDGAAGLRSGRRCRERTGPACDRGAARAPAVDHAVRGALGQRLPALRPRLVRASDRDVEPRQPQRRGAFAGRSRPVRHPHRTAQRRIRRQPVLVDRLGVGGGDRRAGERSPLPPPAESGNLYVKGVPLPESLGVALELATRDDTIADILGADSVHDFAALARSEWVEYSNEVSDWERKRYLARS